jgi:hypothetical protein
MMMRYLRSSSSSSLHGLGESPVPASSIVVIYDLKLKCCLLGTFQKPFLTVIPVGFCGKENGIRE